MKIAWKYIRGFGPYAYAQRSVREGDDVRSEHIAYLGAMGGELRPGATVRIGDETAKVPSVPSPPSARPKVAPNKKRKRRARQYVIKDASGELLYVGVTDNLARREAEHRRDGSLPRGGEMTPETRGVSRDAAERAETLRVAEYVRERGRPPRENENIPHEPGTRRLSRLAEATDADA